MTRPLICILLFTITGFGRIALADSSPDVHTARLQLQSALRHAVLDIVRNGERDRNKVAKLTLQRAQTEVAQFREACVIRDRRSLKRSEAEANANAEIKDSLDSLVENALSYVKDGISLRQNKPGSTH